MPQEKLAARRRKSATPPLAAIPPKTKRRFQRELLKWYRVFGRDLPWRQTSDPYKILVSEVMLQQTQVDRVIPKYHEFLERYPTFHHLAKARPEEVRQTWYPLGYNIRPMRLHSIACETVSRYDGSLPTGAEDLLSFKGIGRYTAGAIRSFAFRQDAPILDTNVMRLLHRVFVGEGDP
jgi:A/G-specific adenine glycosylase